MASLTFISGLLLVSSIGLVVMEAGAGDKQLYFPEFVQNKQASQYWRSAWGTDEAYVEWRFNGAQLKKATYSSTSFISQTWNCTSMDNDTYVTRLTDDNSTATMHLGFKKLTDNVVRTTCASTDAMCEENSTLLIANEPRSKKTLGSCNIHKGSSSFLPKVFNNGSYNQLCVAQPSVLTSECMLGEGMRLEFASATCLPSGFGLPTDVTLYCLESWKDRNSTTVSLLGTTFYDPTHCMVFKSADPNSVYISPGLSCPLSHVEGMLKLDLKPLGLASDTVTNCHVELCHLITNYNRICPQTCHLSPGFDTNATFVGVNGTWWDGEPGGINVEITDDSLKVDGFANFKAIKNVSANTYVISPTNLPSSCLPRVSCIQLETPSESMLRYKISQLMAATSSSADVCSENNFVNDDAPLGSKYRSRFMKNLVDKSTIPDRTAGPCGYTGQFILHAEECTGSLLLSEFSVKLDCVSENTTTYYSCLAGFPLKAFGSSRYKAFVTNSMDSHQCWIWTDDYGGSPRQVYQLSGIDCNQETVEGILSGKLSERIKIRANVTKDETTPIPTSATNTTTPPSKSEPTTKATSATIATAQPSKSKPTTTTTSATKATTQPGPEENETASGVSGGVVAGAVFGVLIGLVLLGVVGFYGYRYIAARRMPYRVL